MRHIVTYLNQELVLKSAAFFFVIEDYFLLSVFCKLSMYSLVYERTTETTYIYTYIHAR